MSVVLCESQECTSEIKNGGKPCVDRTVLYAGAVLATYEKNGYSDSDFYAIVWEEESQTVKTIEYASTRGWTYHNGATIDASPEVIEKAEQYFRGVLFRRIKSAHEQKAADPTKTKIVRSLMTRGNKVGIEGVVMWRGANKHRTYYRNGYNNPDSLHNQVLGLKVEGHEKLVYLPADRVEVVNPAQYVESDEEIQERANAWAAEHMWRSYLTPSYI